MKKFLKSKGFKVTALSVCCVGILAACFFFGRDRGEEFTPDTQVPESMVGEWEEPTGETKTPEADTGAYNRIKESAAAETYPKVVEEDEEEIIVDFAPSSEENKPEAPEKPEAQGDATNPEEPPSYEPEETKPSASEKEENGGNADTPQPGSKNEKGEVYVPGFGWTLPSTVEQTEMDNDGDPNKMVGDM